MWHESDLKQETTFDFFFFMVFFGGCKTVLQIIYVSCLQKLYVPKCLCSTYKVESREASRYLLHIHHRRVRPTELNSGVLAGNVSQILLDDSCRSSNTGPLKNKSLPFFVSAGQRTSRRWICTVTKANSWTLITAGQWSVTFDFFCFCQRIDSSILFHFSAHNLCPRSLSPSSVLSFLPSISPHAHEDLSTEFGGSLLNPLIMSPLHGPTGKQELVKDRHISRDAYLTFCRAVSQKSPAASASAYLLTDYFLLCFIVFANKCHRLLTLFLSFVFYL